MHTPDFPAHHSGTIDPSQRFLRRITIPCAVVVIILGTIGYLHYPREEHGTPSLSNALYHAVQLFWLHTPHFNEPVDWTLELARWLAPLTTVLSVWQFVGSFLNSERAERRLRKMRNHSVVCGLGRKGMCMVAHLRKQNRDVIIIEQNPAPEFTEECHKLGALVLTGNATNPAVLREARTEFAAELYMLCPEDQTNCEIAAVVSGLPHSKKIQPLACHVHLADTDLRTLLQERMAAHTNHGNVQLHFFDVFDPVARKLIMEDLPLDHSPIAENSAQRVHLVLLGLGRMGGRLAVRAAQLGHFANRSKLRISIIDRHARRHLDGLLFRHPALKVLCDVEPHEQELLCPDTDAFIPSWCADKSFVTSIVICMDDEPRALEAALRFLPAAREHGARIGLRMTRESGLARLLASEQSGKGSSGTLQTFGLEEEWCELTHPETDICEKLAIAIHESYRKSEPTKKDNTALATPPWAGLLERFRESNRQQAAHIPVKLRAIGCKMVRAEEPGAAVTDFTATETDLMARMEHARWMAERRMAGWTTGPRDNVKLHHPDLVAWDDPKTPLNKNSREKDYVAVKQIPDLLALIGMKVCRTARTNHNSQV